MIKLNEIFQKINYSNWMIPNTDSLRQEYEIEYKKHVIHQFGKLWNSFHEFQIAIKNAQIKQINKNFDLNIDNRTHTNSFLSLLGMIKSYKSYPKYRNEKTLKNLYNRFKQNKPMDMPIVLNDNENYWIMSGNTRMDIAFQLGINPKILIINI